MNGDDGKEHGNERRVPNLPSLVYEGDQVTHDYDISARGFTQRHYEMTTNTTVHFEEDMPEDTRISVVVLGKPYTVSLADLKGMLRQREVQAARWAVSR